MASEVSELFEECASIALSEISYSTEPPPSAAGSRTKTSKVYNHVLYPSPESIQQGLIPSNTIFCKHCTNQPPYQAKDLSNMNRHLKEKHKIHSSSTPRVKATSVEQLKELSEELYEEESPALDEFEQQVMQRYAERNRMAIIQILVRLIVVRNLPFQAIEWPEFHSLCNLFNPFAKDILPACASTITARIREMYNEQSTIVRDKLQNTPWPIHLSLDVWTSPANQLLLGVMAHFFEWDNTLKKVTLRRVMLGLRTILGHAGEHQCTTLTQLLEEFKICPRISTITGDNATTNDTLCRTFSKYLFEKFRIRWNPVTQRLRCLGHIINLAVQDFLFKGQLDPNELESYENSNNDLNIQQAKSQKFRQLGPLGKLHNIVVHTRASANRYQDFLEKAGRAIPLDNCTRWNSWYNLLHVSFQVESQLLAYINANASSLNQDVLSPKEWDILRTIHTFLEVFKDATTLLEGNMVHMGQVIITMDILSQHIGNSLVRIPPYFLLIY
jgi:hypothetical protein